MQLFEVKRQKLPEDLKKVLIMLTRLIDWKLKPQEAKRGFWYRAEGEKNAWINIYWHPARTHIGISGIHIDHPAQVEIEVSPFAAPPAGDMNALSEKITKAAKREGLEILVRQGNKGWTT